MPVSVSVSARPVPTGGAAITARAVSIDTTTTSTAWPTRLVSGDAADTVSRLATHETTRSLHRRVGELLLGDGAEISSDDRSSTVRPRPPVLLHR